MEEQYFQAGEIDRDRPSADQFVSAWYSKHLRAMNEPALLPKAGGTDEGYRFLWLRTFHHPVAVRIARVSGGATIRWIELDGAGGYEPGAPLVSNTFPIDDNVWTAFVAQLHEGDFWNLPASDGGVGSDGAQWVLEGLQGERRKFVHRWSPSDGIVRELGIRFLELADALPNDDVY